MLTPRTPVTSIFCPQKGKSYVAGTGGSSYDWNTFNLLQSCPEWISAGWSGFSFWIMDGDNVYVLEPGGTQGSELKKNKTACTWNSGACKW